MVVQGALTKGSATYTDALASCIASVFASAIDMYKSKLLEMDSLKSKGLENQVCNEVMTSATWKPVKVWPSKTEPH